MIDELMHPNLIIWLVIRNMNDKLNNKRASWIKSCLNYILPSVHSNQFTMGIPNLNIYDVLIIKYTM